MGNAAIGYFGGLVAIVAALVSLLGGQLGKCNGGKKWPLMLIGGLAFALMGSCFLFYPDPVAEWKGKGRNMYFALAVVYAAQGVGRGVFESTNKACVADFFSAKDTPAAFANIVWSSGGSAAIGFFLFPHISLHLQSLVTCICALLGIVCYFAALGVHMRSEMAVREGGIGAEEQPKCI